MGYTHPKKNKRSGGKRRFFCIDAEPANLSQMLDSFSICLKIKDELKVLETTKQEVHSTNVYMEREEYSSLVFLEQKHETVIHYVKH